MKKAVTKANVRDWVRKRLASSVLWAKTAIVAVYNKQMPCEKRVGRVLLRNAVGFSRYDVERGTHLAKKILCADSLTRAETREIRALAPRYWEQFIENFGWRAVRHRYLEEHGQLFLPLEHAK